MSRKRNADLSDFKMIRRYKVHSQISKYKAIFEMVIEDGTARGKTLPHLRELIFQHDHQEIPPSLLPSFHESYQEMEIVGNSINDLIPPDFRACVMQDAVCQQFWREDHVVQRTDYIEKQQYLSNPQEWEDQIAWWREDNETEMLTLAGVPLNAGKPRKRKATAVAAASNA